LPFIASLFFNNKRKFIILLIFYAISS